VAKDFRELVVWEQAMVLAEHIYELTRELPADERFGLKSQMRRAAVSVPSCIAEGNARASIPDYLRFLSMSAGSLAELRTQLLLAQRLGLVSPAKSEASNAQVTRVEMLLKRLQTALRFADRKRATTSPSRFPFPVSRS
jgi:carbamoyl-phosphate synthase large subunit